MTLRIFDYVKPITGGVDAECHDETWWPDSPRDVMTTETTIELSGRFVIHGPDRDAALTELAAVINKYRI